MYKRFYIAFARAFSFTVILMLAYDYLLPRFEIDRRWITLALATSLFTAYYAFVVFHKSDSRKVRWLKLFGLSAGDTLITYGFVLIFGYLRNLQTWVLIVIPIGFAVWGVICGALTIWFVKAANKRDLEEINEQLQMQIKDDGNEKKSG